MKHLLILLSAAFLFVSCVTGTTTTEVSPEEAQSSIQQIQSSLHVGSTTFDEIKKKLGEPIQTNKLDNGAMAVWQWTYTISRTIGSQPVTRESFDASSTSGMYHHVETRTSTLEALFNQEGILTNFSMK